jgi:soluble cytochrome b562
MNTLNKVYSKLNSKTELATHKVDLATVQTIIKQAEKISKNVNSASIDLDNAADKAEDGFKSAASQLDSLNSSVSEALKMVKDLGVDIPKNLDNAISSLKISQKNISKGLVRAKNAKI